MVIRRRGMVDIHATLTAQKAQLEAVSEDFRRVRQSQQFQRRQLEDLGKRIRKTGLTETRRRKRTEERRAAAESPRENKLQHLVILLFIVFMMRARR